MQLIDELKFIFNDANILKIVDRKFGILLLVFGLIFASYGFIMVNHDHKLSVKGADEPMDAPYEYSVPYASPRVDYLQAEDGSWYVGWSGYPESQFHD